MTTRVDERRVAASERSRAYSLLATALAYPTVAGTEGIAAAISDGAPGFPTEIQPLLAELAVAGSSDLTSLQRSHQKLFPQIESQDTPGYETAYRGDEIFNHTAIMADIAGFYRAFGLEVGGATRERPDHVTVELEYLAFISFKEAQFDDDSQADLCADAERLFLADHLGDWGPELGRRVERHADHDFFRVVGRLLDFWINRRLDDLGIDPDGSAGTLVPSASRGDAEPFVCEPSAWQPVRFKDKQ